MRRRRRETAPPSTEVAREAVARAVSELLALYDDGRRYRQVAVQIVEEGLGPLDIQVSTCEEHGYHVWLIGSSMLGPLQIKDVLEWDVEARRPVEP